MSAQFLMISEIDVVPDESRVVISQWRSLAAADEVIDRSFYQSLEGDKVIEISALKSLALNSSLLSSFSDTWEALGTYMKSDFRRQLLQFVEAPKDTRDNIPSTPYLQLRHVEVPPGNFKGYRKWRDETIFDVVRNAEEVEVFLAYHSVISNEPGVMFLSGFSNNVDAYQSVFNSDRYKDIVQQAGDQYITGGQNGLYTRLYRLVS